MGIGVRMIGWIWNYIDWKWIDGVKCGVGNVLYFNFGGCCVCIIIYKN